MHIAIDAGHGYVKAIAGGGQRVRFPALLHPVSTTVNLGEFGRPAITRIDESSYIVGDAARRGATPLWSREKAIDQDTLRLMLIAAAECGGQGPVHLATGLPLAWFGAQRETFRTALELMRGRVVLPSGRTTTVRFESVMVLPQGVAAAGPILDHSHYAPGPYLLVDVGYRTTDFIIVTKDAQGRLDFDPLAAGSLEIGMHAVQEGLAHDLSDQHRMSWTAAQVADAESLVIKGERIDVRPDRQRHETHVARRIVQGLLESLDGQMDRVLGLIAVGGGAGLVHAAVPHVIQPADPQWANAQGYWMALKAMQAIR